MAVEDAITKFFKSNPESEYFVDPTRFASWQHEGEHLKYELILDRLSKTISISGDLTHPFSGSSLFELCILFDRVAIETEPQFYGDQEILVFRKDYENDADFKCLMIMQWGNGELSIWPQIHDATASLLKAWDNKAEC